MSVINTDIYKINEFVNDIKKKFIEVDNEATLAMGMYGYQGEVFSRLLQNSIIVSSEFVNEAIPTKARFDSNIMAHAMSYGIKGINATPSQMEILLGFKESDISKLISNKKFIIDKNIKFYIQDFEFHIDYDIILTRVDVKGGQYAYTVHYNIDRDNPLSDIRNKYLDSPIIVNEKNGDRTIFIRTLIRQVEYLTVNSKILSSNTLENKIFTFDFEQQLADFEIKVLGTSTSDESKYLAPVFEGVIPDKEDYCYYSYLNANTIRVRFDMNSYVPSLNNEVEVLLKTTQGASGNFSYDKDVIQLIESTDRVEYNNLPMVIRPLSSAMYGDNRKTIEEIRKMLPKEAFSRESITTTADLNAYFNVIDSDTNKLTFEKKRDNVLQRKYYTYMLLKDIYENVVPTNTVNVSINSDSIFESEDDYSRSIIPSGTGFYTTNNNTYCDIATSLKIYNLSKTTSFIEKQDSNYLTNELRKINPDITDFAGCVIMDNNARDNIPNNLWVCTSYTPTSGTKEEVSVWEKLDNQFLYTTPFTICVNPANKIISYYLTSFKKNLYLNYITDKNTELSTSQCQFIIPSLSWNRNFGEKNYNIEFEFSVNIDDLKDKVEGLYVFVVLYNANDKPIAYLIDRPNYNILTEKYKFSKTIETDDIINIKDNGTHHAINLKSGDEYDLKPLSDDVYGLGEMKCNIFTFIVDESVTIDPDSKDGVFEENGVTIYDFNHPYDLTNKYEVDGKLNFFMNYSSKISSKLVGDVLKSVPVVRYDYMHKDIDNSIFFTDTLETKRNYMENALKLLEDSFEFDFKFYNTYGPSRLFNIDGETLNKININLSFEVKVKESADGNILNNIKQEIKSYIENLNNIGSIHISNLIYHITNKFQESIYYIEFVSVNNYETNKQYLEKLETDDIDVVPEFLNIEVDDNYGPMIKISMV